jgi:hypothetical protein
MGDRRNKEGAPQKLIPEAALLKSVENEPADQRE